MLLSYEECIKRFQSYYQLKKQIDTRKIYKLEKGVYSTEKNVPELAIIAMKYPRAVLTINSALFFYGLTEEEPEYYYLATDKDDAKIIDKRVKQSFERKEYLYLGMTEAELCGSSVKVYSKERLLIEVVRNRRKFSYGYYRDIIRKYRKMINELDIDKINEYVSILPKSKMIIETLRREVF